MRVYQNLKVWLNMFLYMHKINIGVMVYFSPIIFSPPCKLIRVFLVPKKVYNRLRGRCPTRTTWGQPLMTLVELSFDLTSRYELTNKLKQLINRGSYMSYIHFCFFLCLPFKQFPFIYRIHVLNYSRFHGFPMFVTSILHQN